MKMLIIKTKSYSTIIITIFTFYDYEYALYKVTLNHDDLYIVVLYQDDLHNVEHYYLVTL